MLKIIPYKTTRNALASLDNGGRFFNWSSKAHDGNITSAELSKVVGAFSGKQVMMLHLEMSMAQLPEEGRNQILKSLTLDLKKAKSKYPVSYMPPSEAQKNGKIGSSAIITGIPKLVDAKTEFTGFIMVPITTNNVTTFIIIPIFEQYDVYQLRDSETAKEVLIAHAKRSQKLPERTFRCAGILKELKNEDKDNAKSNIFLETLYYSEVLARR